MARAMECFSVGVAGCSYVLGMFFADKAYAADCFLIGVFFMLVAIYCKMK